MILSLSENVVLASLKRLFPRRFVDAGKEREVVAEYIRDLRIATPSPKRLVQFLSGGTQQKVVLAKWLCTHSRIFIFDEPTRGIDVGAKAEIHGFMNELVKQGAAVLMISSDLPEILGMSDRIYVMRQGQVVAEVPRDRPHRSGSWPTPWDMRSTMNEVVSTKNVCMEKKRRFPMEEGASGRLGCAVHDCVLRHDSLGLLHRREFPEHHAAGLGAAHPGGRCHPGYPDGGHRPVPGKRAHPGRRDDGPGLAGGAAGAAGGSGGRADRRGLRRGDRPSHHWGKLPPFIASLGMMGIAAGMALVSTRQGAIYSDLPVFIFLGGGSLGMVPMPTVLPTLVFASWPGLGSIRRTSGAISSPSAATSRGRASRASTRLGGSS